MPNNARMTDYYGGSFVGTSYMSDYAAPIDYETTYDTVTFFGGNGGVIVDKLYGESLELTSEEFLARCQTTYVPAWGPYTYILAEFNGSLAGGNIFNIDNHPIEKWIVYRITDDAGIMEYIGEASATQSYYIDYTVVKGHTYRYQIYGQSATQVSSPLLTQQINIDYYGWYLIDQENEAIYAFDLNFSGGEISQATTYNEYNTNLPYNAYSYGATDYAQGSITALVLEDIEEKSQSAEYLDELKNTIQSKYAKYLKDNKGRLFKVFTYDYKDTMIAYGINEEPRYVSFAFKECGKA